MNYTKGDFGDNSSLRTRIGGPAYDDQITMQGAPDVKHTIQTKLPWYKQLLTFDSMYYNLVNEQLEK
jgi:hypothetical protein